MGDNRDESADSRVWDIEKKDTIKAKINNLYWSWDKDVNDAQVEENRKANIIK